jgi:tetratricopeptide (TPR) repeat protein
MVQNKSEVIKTNLASVALILGLDSFARLKYEEMVKYFPTNPEGFYGVALTAPSLGDYENGLVHINKAIDKYDGYSEKENSDPYFIKGILLALTGKYEEGKEYLDKAPRRLKKQEHFNIFYSLCLLKIGIANQDDKLKKKAKKYYNKIQFKDEIPKDVKRLLVFE